MRKAVQPLEQENERLRQEVAEMRDKGTFVINRVLNRLSQCASDFDEVADTLRAAHVDPKRVAEPERAAERIRWAVISAEAELLGTPFTRRDFS